MTCDIGILCAMLSNDDVSDGEVALAVIILILAAAGIGNEVYMLGKQSAQVPTTSTNAAVDAGTNCERAK